MPRKPPGRTSDPVAAIPNFGASAVTDDTRWDALRALKQRQNDGRLTEDEAVELALALGLDALGKPAKTVVSPSRVACPRCGAAPKYPCKPLRSGRVINDVHVDRYEAAKEAA